MVRPGSFHDSDAIVNTYGEPRNEWEETRRALEAMPRQQLIVESGIDRSLLYRYLTGEVVPRPARKEELRLISQRYGVDAEASFVRQKS